MPEEIYSFRKWHIPARMMPGIRRYVDHGQQPGSFLTAVIQNNLYKALGQADEENLENIPAFVDYFYNECPVACWGSEEKMEAWMKRKEEVTHGN